LSPKKSPAHPSVTTISHGTRCIINNRRFTCFIYCSWFIDTDGYSLRMYVACSGRHPSDPIEKVAWPRLFACQSECESELKFGYQIHKLMRRWRHGERPADVYVNAVHVTRVPPRCETDAVTILFPDTNPMAVNRRSRIDATQIDEFGRLHFRPSFELMKTQRAVDR
jgi:hypothetical protein